MSLPIMLSGVSALNSRPFVWTTNLLYRFNAGAGVFRDNSSTPAADSDTAQVWQNLGSAENAVQNTSSNRPTYKTGGLNGQPYIQCTAALQQFFENIAFTQPSGTTTLNPFTVFAVTNSVTLSDFRGLMGSTAANGGKVALYFRSEANAQVHLVKTAIRVGNIANPQVLMAAAGRNSSGTTSSPHTRFWLRRNKQDIYTGASETSSVTSTAIGSTQFLRNTGITGSDGFFEGHLYEFLLYDGTLSDADTFAIENWLSSKYGII
jgi:hypothetical protein